MSDRIQQFIKALAACERFVIGALMAAITILTLAQVFWRYILVQPLQWSEEIARYCFVWVTFIGAATLLRLKDGHPVIDALYHVVGPKTQLVMDVVSRIVVIGGTLAIAVGGFRLVQLQLRQLSPSVELPMMFVYSSMIVGPLLGVFWLLWRLRHGPVEDNT